MLEKKVIGVDIGGTSISAGLIQGGKLIGKLKVNTPALESKQVVIDAVVETIAKVAEGHEITGIGVGVPGLVDINKGIVYDLVNIPSWDEVHLSGALRDCFGWDVHVDNDANCFVVGEKVYGKGKPYDSIVGITLGTGLGLGFIFNNKLHSGLMSAAGEVGAIPYMLHDYEHYCSGKFFQKEFGLDGNVVFERAMGGHEVFAGIFKQFGLHLGHLIKQVLHIVAPEAIYIGGSIKDAFPMFEKAIWEVLESFPYQRMLDNLIIDKSEINDVAIMGAAAVYEMRRYKDSKSKSISL